MTSLATALNLVSAPFTHFISDDVLEHNTVRELSAQFDRLRALTQRAHSKPGGDKSYSMDFLALVVADQETDAVSALPSAWQDLCKALAHPNFRAALSRQTGIDVTGDRAEIGAYLHRSGDSVSVHCDKQHKSLSCILYLNEEWHDTDGGDFLLFATDDLDRPVQRITPTAGRLIVFAPVEDSWHAVSPITATRYVRQTLQIEFTPAMCTDG